MLPLVAERVDSATSGVLVVLAVAAGLILAVVVAEAATAALRAAGRRRWWAAVAARRARLPLLAVSVVLMLALSLSVVRPEGPGPGTARTLGVLAVLAVAWLLLAVLPALATRAVLGGASLSSGATRGGPASAAALRHGVSALTVAGAAVAVLLIVPATRTAGVVALATVLVLVTVLAVATLPFLRQVVAGLQLAATDALRVDDVVVVDGVWGRVEQVTATSVVVQAWDDRRLVVPHARLTEEPFESWTRGATDLVGTVDLELDPAVPVTLARAELVRVVDGNDLWDRRVAVLQVTGATGGRVQVRAVVSAADPPRLHDLRADVLEALVEWQRVLAGGSPADAVPPAGSRRAETGEAGGGEADRTVRLDPRRDARLFTGSVFAVERSRAFTGPGADVRTEREGR